MRDRPARGTPSFGIVTCPKVCSVAMPQTARVYILPPSLPPPPLSTHPSAPASRMRAARRARLTACMRMGTRNVWGPMSKCCVLQRRGDGGGEEGGGSEKGVCGTGQ